jgi:hypothetical protein
MHPLLQPIYPVRLAIVSGGLWCAWTAAAVLVRTTENNTPPPAAADPPAPLTVMVRTVPISPELAFAERWPAVQGVTPAAVAESQQVSIQPQPEPPKARHVEAAPRDPVCGNRGRRYFHIGRHLSWRCRR